MKWMRTLALAALVGLPVTAQAADPGVTKDSILFGSFLGLSGDLALASADMKASVEAYFAKVNDEGGVHGRKLKYLAVDDGFVAARSAIVARRLVEQDGVFALHATTATANNIAVMPYVQSKGVPVFGITGNSPKMFEPAQPMMYGNWSPFAPQVVKMGDYFVKNDTVKVFGVAYIDNEGGVAGAVGADAVAKKHNLPLVRAPLTPGAPDYRSVVLNMRDKGVTHVLLLSTPRETAILIRQAHEANWFPKFGGHAGIVDPVTLQLGGADVEGSLFAVASVPLADWDYPEFPGVKEYVATMKKYAPDAKPGGYGIRAYADSILLVEALRRAGPEPTREGLIKGIESLKDFPTGIYPPVTFGPDKHIGNESGILVAARGGRFVPIKE